MAVFFIEMLPSVKFVEDKVFFFFILRENDEIVHF